MEKFEIRIPIVKLAKVSEQKTVRVDAEAYNILAEICNNSMNLSIKEIASKIIKEAAPYVVYAVIEKEG
jgi:hypothetical protein